VVTLVWPTITTLALTVVIGAWAIATGLLDVWTAVRHRGSWLLALVGVVAIAAGILVLRRPVLGAVAIAQVIGIYAIVAGVLMLAEAWRRRRFVATPVRGVG
jgi:uncharacterized membrane protein HdeD (DUF308 family)